MERREFITATAGASLWLLGTAKTANAEEKVLATPKIKGKIFELEHKLKPLPFNPTKLQGLSEKMIQSHWENNYGGSVKTLNGLRKRIGEAIEDKDTSPYILNGLKREHLLRTGSVILHEVYFGNLGGSGKCGTDLQNKISSDFGSFENWQNEFKKIAQGLGGGSGWVILGYNYHFKTIENYWSWDHMHSPPATVPLLAMDMYEHSYQMDYGAAAAKYIDAFIQNINWEIVEARLERALKLKWI
ncbi:MAG: superoxide dismutase [Bdellovibrio sp. 28-41-41]|nr:MAG: superoxide dismutase [Bdellovibrio sp. 28-41-41]